MATAKTKKTEEVKETTAEVTEVVETKAEKAKKTESKVEKIRHYRSKKYLAAAEKVEKTSKYNLEKAVELAKETAYSKFKGSLELHITTSNKNVRGLVTLPHLSGKQLTILAFGDKAAEAGADMVGDDKKLEDIMKGKIDFDALVATPVWMVKLARAAKVLGPRGLMPNPKNGTVSDNLEKAILELKSGKVEYRTENNLPTMHLGIGKLEQPSEELMANIRTLYAAIGKSKIKRLLVSPTMGPAIRVDLSSI